MAITIPIDTDHTVSLEEYVDYVRKNVDPDDEASIIASAPVLKALANNRTFLAHFVNDEILRSNDFQTTNSYTAQTILLALHDRIVVRANLWEPVVGEGEARNLQERLFFYDVPHDHNFPFVTVGYKGAGYSTDIWEVDPESVTGIAGEPADIRFLERTTLPEGKVMFYRAGRDIHSQDQPAEFSVSLNLLIVPKAETFHDQHFFDLENRRLGSVATGGNNASRILFCRLARFLGDATTKAHLEAIAQSHPANRVRATAIESLAVMEPGCAEVLWRRATNDAHPQVRYAAREALARLAGDATAVRVA